MTTGVYDRATGCTGGPAPGATHLLEIGLQNFPGVSSGGIYSCRAPRVGSGWSEHAEGRAVDFMVPLKALGDQLAAWAIRVPGVQTVIWYDRAWTSTNPVWHPYVDSGGRPYADPTTGHRDHVHVGLTRAAGASGTVGAGVSSVQALAGGVGNTIAGLGGSLVEGAVDPLLEGLQRVLITGALLWLGVALIVSGGYRAVTGGRKLTHDTIKTPTATDLATAAATGGASTAATAGAPRAGGASRPARPGSPRSTR